MSGQRRKPIKKPNPIEFLTGFLMGACLCIFMEAALIIFYNLVSAWTGWPRLNAAWWMLLPLPLAVGLFMGGAIASLHLEDY